ncbi:MAG: acetolactate decarboxylase [Methanocalculus sp. MSAO_Arc2]|uniref:acetolactate decarboxylase n=1 Tax=Methanocalculus sp. MSAO_Arc2 TaxID=2293855 RepID=UPI000FF79EF0|nr:MAG: acetolactate decarboxylase [Methanocalculus sp. MSAO_Arc2]
MRPVQLVIITLLLGVVLGAGMMTIVSGPANSLSDTPLLPDSGIFYQVSTIDALLEGIYDGVISSGELIQYGDLGIGTFDSLDGELILLDGVVYQARADGSVHRASDDLMVPFATVTYFNPSITIEGLHTTGYAGFEEHIDELIRSKNLMYAIRIDGDFSSVIVRAPHRQEHPFSRLVDALEDQYMATHTDVSGSSVGFFLPGYFGGLNVPGYHLHFISDDRTIGGHIVDFSLDGAYVALEEGSLFLMHLPGEGAFINVDLSADLLGDLAVVERPAVM